MSHGRTVRNIALIVASAMSLAGGQEEADAPPENLLQRIAATASDHAKARDEYTYRQVLTVQDFDHANMVEGQYREVRDVTFSPNGSRYEQAVGQSLNTLTKIELTPQDFDDIRKVQPFLLTKDNAWLYSAKYKGVETIDGIPCYVAFIEPKQILSGQRYFQGTLWVRQSDFAVVRSEGQAVPQIDTLKQQNLFPHFATQWKEVDGKWMFPSQTQADDTLFFRDWPQRIRVTIQYANYRKFGAQSTLSFGGEAAQPADAQGQVPTAPAH